MKNSTPTPRDAALKGLQLQVKKLQSELEKVNKAATGGGAVSVQLRKTEAHFKKMRGADNDGIGIGDFFLYIDVTAVKETVYIPLSIASGKKPTGFVYQIEGTAEGTIAAADIEVKGEGITQVTLGTILYAKIPKSVTATFRVAVEIRGRVGKSYAIVVGRMHFKRNPNEVRYERLLKEISSKTLKFK